MNLQVVTLNPFLLDGHLQSFVQVVKALTLVNPFEP